MVAATIFSEHIAIGLELVWMYCNCSAALFSGLCSLSSVAYKENIRYHEKLQNEAIHFRTNFNVSTKGFRILRFSGSGCGIICMIATPKTEVGGLIWYIPVPIHCHIPPSDTPSSLGPGG